MVFESLFIRLIAKSKLSNEPIGKALREPVGNIHWAGTETSDVWNGYIDGAIRSGERVAKEILG